MSGISGNNGLFEDEAELEKLSRGAFSNLPPVSAPNFLSHRVLAELRGRKNAAPHRWWKWTAVSASVSTFALLAFVSLFVWGQHREVFAVALGQPVSVKVEMKGIHTERVAMVEVDLPDGVHFYSERYPQINEQSKISIAWNEHQTHGDAFPFVVKGKVAGLKQLTIRFLDANKKLIAERTINVRFATDLSDQRGDT